MSSRMFITVLAALLVSSVLLTGVISQDRPDPNRESNVIGKVMDGETETPLDASIIIHGTKEQSWKFEVRTNNEGVFTAQVPAGKIYILVESEGYYPYRAENEVEEGSVLELKILLEPKETDEAPEPNVFGHVFDIDENPIHAFVVFYGDNNDGMKAESDRSGMFKLHLAPGLYKWKATAEGSSAEEGELEVPREGETRLIIMMNGIEDKPLMGSIHGMVINLENEPIPGAHIIFIGVETPRDPSLETKGGVHGPEDMVFETVSGRDGTFTIKLPLGLYLIEAHAEGYHPFMMEIAITTEHPEARAVMEMEWVGHDEEFEEPNIRLSMEMTDEDSDGNPEKLHVIVHVDDDEEPDLVLLMIDKNSDGNPESTKFEMDMEKHLVVRILEMISDRMNMQRGYPPFPEEPQWEENWDRDGNPDVPDRDGHWNENGEWTPNEEGMPPVNGMGPNDPGDLEDERRSEDGKVGSSTVSDKGSDSNVNGRIPAMVGAIGVLLIVVTLIVLAGYVIKIRKKN